MQVAMFPANFESWPESEVDEDEFNRWAIQFTQLQLLKKALHSLAAVCNNSMLLCSYNLNFLTYY
jgi:hypothetical protein